MLYNDFKELKLSRLGFGTMRFPTLPEKTAADIDYEQTEKIIKYAMDNGVNYFDTAYVYHGGMSEVVLAKILKQYPRETYYIATKYPGHSISNSYNPAEIFEDQLKNVMLITLTFIYYIMCMKNQLMYILIQNGVLLIILLNKRNSEE